MTKTYDQLKKQIEALSQQAEAVRRKEVAGVVARIKEAIQAYELTAEDLGFGSGRAGTSKSGAKKARPAAKGRRRSAASATPRYRDPSGNVWGGRGPRPKWLREAIASGRKLEEFAV
ncbi:H-NS histone family protein [Aquincola sp. J276]|uniref:H-NS histone family protein n=1 Tax=Aquincola sp. J276 TaxID=2898432 RepID=UPI002150A299|nr:H-NS histone family protein [Aquincola sp. J276]MCR5863706.1 H-NS histone family protein [Aquincola sp. J276]